MHCKTILGHLVVCKGDRSKFCEDTLDLTRWSNTMTDYIYEDLKCDKVEWNKK